MNKKQIIGRQLRYDEMMEKDKFFRDEEGNLCKRVKYFDENGNLTEHVVRADISFAKKRNTLQDKEDHYVYMIRRMIDSILQDKSDAEIERAILQIIHPQTKLLEALKKDIDDEWLLHEIVTKYFAAELAYLSVKDINKVTKRVSQSKYYQSNDVINTVISEFSDLFSDDNARE